MSTLIKDKDMRLEQVRAGLAGDVADLKVLQKEILNDIVIVVNKILLLDEDTTGEHFVLIFEEGEITGGMYKQGAYGCELTIEEAEEVANAFNIDSL